MSLLLPIFGGIILFAVITIAVGLPARALRSKFISLGTLKGKTKNQIISIVGPPKAVSAAGENKTLLQWIAAGYHIRLIFNGDICEGVNHEYWRGY